MLHNRLKPDLEKARVVVELPTPKGLQRFLGMVTYLSKFIPCLNDLSSPLRKSLQQESWSCGDGQLKSFERIKEVITTAPALKYYDENKSITLTCDASNRGLGAVRLQKGRPVAYASRALTATQEKYAQIEKELLAIVFACTKFHRDIYGRQVMVETKSCDAA